MNSSLDTCALLRYLLGDVPEEQARMKRLFDRGGRFIVEEMVLLEIAQVLDIYYHLSRYEIATTLGTLVFMGNLDFDHQLLGAVITAYYGSNKLSFPPRRPSAKPSHSGPLIKTWQSNRARRS